MISILSSYKLATVPGSAGETDILPNLAAVCEDAFGRGFIGVDVVVSRADLESTRAKHSALERDQRLKAMATDIQEAIRASISPHKQSSITVPLDVCALATNLSAISDPLIDNQKAWMTAVEYLSVCICVAHLLGTPVVEIVCGSRVCTVRSDDNSVLFITAFDDDDVLSGIRRRFANGVCKAFSLASDILKIGKWPEVGLAVEMEPDLMSLARNLDDAKLLLDEIDTVLRETGKDPDAYRKHFGLNLDWGHLLLAADRGFHQSDRRLPPPENDRAAAEWYVTRIKNLDLQDRVMHAHASDHYPGAHRADAPIGTFRPRDAYAPFWLFQAELFNRHATEEKSSRCPYFSYAVAIELEARQRLELAVTSRECLYQLRDDQRAKSANSADTKNTDIETESDRLRHVEQRIAKAGRAEGWLEGINRAVYDSLQSLARRTKCPEPALFPLLDEETLGLIRKFLAAQEQDTRTRRAVELAEHIFKKLGAQILTNWLDDLLDKEYGRGFFSGYRDHTVHSVYVFLLGLYLYAESEQVREQVYKDDLLSTPEEKSFAPSLLLRSSLGPNATRGSFFAKWALTSLTHDIGYPFEGEKTIPAEARKILENTVNSFAVSIALLGVPKGERIKKKDAFGTVVRECLTSAGIGESDLLLENHPLFIVPKPPVSAASSDSKGYCPDTFEKIVETAPFIAAFLGPDSSLTELFDLFRTCEPSKKDDSPDRQLFLDHGFMSCAIIRTLVGVCQKWNGEWVTKALEALEEYAKQPGNEEAANDIKKSLQDWQRTFLAPANDADVDRLLREVYFAVAVHNIVPERNIKDAEESDGPIYGEPKKDELPALRVLRKLKVKYKEEIEGCNLPFLSFFLPLCDVLHEWHRFGFSNPLALKHQTLSPLDVVASFDPQDGKVHLRYSDPEGFQAGDSIGSFSKRKKLELTRKLGSYWEHFVQIDTI